MSSRPHKPKNARLASCGQAPSDYPEFAQFLVEQGIDSISLNPDAVLKTLLAVAEMERTRAGARARTPGRQHASTRAHTHREKGR